MQRLDDLLNGYTIWQDTELFCFGIDAVLLAHYPRIRAGDRVLDLGCGVGPVPLILHAEARKRGFFGETDRTRAKGRFHITGLEIEERAASLARQSVADNGLSGDIDIRTGDIREAAALFAPASFSLVTCNPPYMKAGAGYESASAAKAIARTELLCTLDDVVSAAGRLLKMNGRFAMIHRPERLQEICVLLSRYGLALKRIRFVEPHAGEAPVMVLVGAVRGGRAGVSVEPPLVVYGEGQTYTEEIREIYGRNTVSGGDTDRKS